MGKVGNNLSLFPNETKRLRLRARDPQFKVTQERWWPSPQGNLGGPSPLPLTSDNPKQRLRAQWCCTPPPTLPLPPNPHSPTSAPTDPPTSCHCLGSNPSSGRAAWRALPGQGASGPQDRPLMPRRVGGPGLRAGLGPQAWACLSACCPLQKPGELIKNTWAGRGGRGCRPRPQPSSSWPSPQLQAASSPSEAHARCRCRLPGGIRLLQSMLPAPPALPMPLSGAGGPPHSLAQACKQIAEIWAVYPQNPSS